MDFETLQVGILQPGHKILQKPKETEWMNKNEQKVEEILALSMGSGERGR